MSVSEHAAGGRWSGKPLQAAALRAGVFLAPLAGSVVFVHFASQVVPAPSGSLALFLSWWLGLSALATVVLVLVDRVTRRLLPLVALLKLSLVFPDQAPSRFKVALRAGSTERLEEKLNSAGAATASDAAAQLLELVAALNIHDRLTRGHCERVRAYSVMIGEELGLSKADLDLLNWAALLHDVGKLRIPVEILGKEGSPTDAEWDVLRRHPLYGEELVEPIRDWLGPWISAVGFHHERWDGGGYPNRLAGEEIPLAGRIVAVADSFDVMTSARSYKEAGVATAARAELAACAGTQFDPNVVRAFLNVGLGRMRFVMGPLSWLAHAPLLGRLPLTPAMGTLAGAFTVAAGSAAGGLVATTPAAASAAPVAPVAHVRHVAGSRPASVTQPRHDYVHLVNPPEQPAEPGPAAPSPASAPVQVPPPPATPAPAPAPADDHATAREGQSVTIDVLANDVGGPLQLLSVGTPSHGSATVLGQSVVYSASPGGPTEDAFDYTVTGTAGQTATARVTVEILPVNDPPTFDGGGDVAVLEDSGPHTGAWATSIGSGLGDGHQSVHFVVEATQPELFTAQPQIAQSGVLTFTPAADANGGTGLRVTAVDNGGRANGGSDQSAPADFTIDLRPVNDPPSFLAGGNVSVQEGAGAQVQLWATKIFAGPPNESAQTVAFATSTDSPGLFAAGGEPTVGPNGELRFTPAPFASGTATVTVTARDDGGTVDGGRDATSAMFTLTVTHVNQPPRFTGSGDVTVAEDSGPYSSNWASSIDGGAPDETGQVVSFTTANDNPALFSAQPALDAAGHLTFTPATNAHGSATVTVTAHDDGGTADGGHDTSSKTFTITVATVNDPPTYTGAGNQSILEDAGAQSTQWATAIAPGPADESAQTVAFTASNDNNALFSVQPSIDASGTLTYTPAADANGVATVTVAAHDDGGTAGGGNDTTTSTFTISVAAVNDSPSYAGAGNQTVLEDAGARSAQWATSIAPGPANETGQTVAFNVSNDNNGLFSSQPAIDAAGVLSYTPAADANGTATVTVTAYDNGGTANGGHDSTVRTFTISVNSVNDAPTVASIPNQTVNEDDGPQVASVTTFGTGPANEGAQTLLLTTTTDHPEYFDVAGQPTVDAAGTLSYTPAVGAIGTATVTVTAQDDGGTANGGVDTTSRTFTITIAALPPDAGDDAYTTTLGTSLHVAAPGVLANDADVNASLSVVPLANVPTTAGGTISIGADGTVDYTPPFSLSAVRRLGDLPGR